MLAAALAKALGGIKLGEFMEEIGLGKDHWQDFWISCVSGCVLIYTVCLDFLWIWI
jgi:hypothetical protein